MDLTQAIEYIQDHRKDLTLFNLGEPSIAEELRSFFSTQNLRIQTAGTASGRPRALAILSSGRTILAIVDVSVLRELTESVPRASDVGIADSEYADLLRHLKETTFTSYDTEQLLYASREIEDRARRVGQGTIHAGFQRFSVMAEQEQIYSDLARRGIDVYAYGIPDTQPPDFATGEIHATNADEIAESWFVIFDGGGTNSQKSALIATERAEDDWFGAWTYDPAIVDRLCEYLDGTYRSRTSDTPL